ncbi:MAG: 3-phosphoshikimate 1-carboxyvinyltransferase [Spirochaetaceae bacterium]|nr:MAG: 3-phosphoshikimate 1-carboxyvinyltransferase [Spirochaetaceae bacterium]
MTYCQGSGKIAGRIPIPGSKSHTIRALLIASLADGQSTIRQPLYSADTRSCIAACRAFGARIEETRHCITVQGVAGKLIAPESPIDVGNSGTTLYLAAAMAALAEGTTEFTGDKQIQARPAAPLLNSLRDLGARIEYLGTEGCAPFRITGPITGGRTSIECKTSQYLSSLLMALPLIAGEKAATIIDVPLLNEQPYVEITVSWLKKQGIHLEQQDWSRWIVPPGQRYKSFDLDIPADFSSATFFFCAAAMTGSALRLDGLDMTDSQGDKGVLDIMLDMGCKALIYENEKPMSIAVFGPGHPYCPSGSLRGGEFDLNAMPDALPALAACACAASEEVRLVNVPQAREKETDRIAVMAAELSKMGADISELPDGLIIRPSRLHAAEVDGHDDHRVVMALAIAALIAHSNENGQQETCISGAEAAAVTFPEFFTLLAAIIEK